MVLFEPLGLPYKHDVLDGVPLTSFTPGSRIKEIQNAHKSRPDDVYIATYQKSGTTWLSQILCLMYDYPQGQQKSIMLDIPWLEQQQQSYIDNALSPRIMKTHLKWRWVPKAEGLKYIYCYRNPKDVTVSYYHHMYMLKHYCYDGTFNDFVNDVFLAENGSENGTYFDHVAEWLEQKDNKNIHFLTYERLSENFEREVKAIANFLNIQLSEEKMKIIKGESSFDAMKNSDRVNFKDPDERIKKKNTSFIRKGKVGDWKNYLSEEQSKEIEERSKRLISLGADIRYELD